MEDKNIKYYIGKELSGAEFNKYFPNLSKNLIKLTNETECHNEFQFKTGLNVDTITFNPKGRCEPGGIYFTDIGNISIWLHYGVRMQYYRYITLPDDCRVYLESYEQFKADKIILSEREKIENFPLWLDEDYCVNAIRNSGVKHYDAQFYIKNYSKEVQLALVTKDEVYIAILLRRGIEVSEEVQLAAMKRNSYSTDAIRYLLDYKVYVSDKVKLAAIDSHWYAARILIDRKIDMSEDLLLKAVEKNYNVIRGLLYGGAEVSEKIKLAAVNNNYEAIYYLLFYKTHISEEVKKIAVEKSGITFENLVLNSYQYARWG